MSIEQKTILEMAEVETGAGGVSVASRRALVIFNPTAGGSRRRRLRATVQELERLGCRVTLAETRAAGDAERMAREASPDLCDVVVAAGGDGTINEVACGLVASAHGLPLGIIPLGTANVLAHDVGLKITAGAAARAILGGRRQTIHLGKVNGRHFVLMAGAGVDAHVVACVDLALKRRTGKFAYVVESLKQAVRYDFPPLTVTVDGEAHEARMAVICNGRMYGGPFIAAPHAHLAKSGLFVILLRRGGFMSVLRYGVALAAGKLPSLADVSVLPARRVRIEGPQDAPVQGDGDVLATLPAELTVSDQTLDLMVP